MSLLQSELASDLLVNLATSLIFQFLCNDVTKKAKAPHK